MGVIEKASIWGSSVLPADARFALAIVGPVLKFKYGERGSGIALGAELTGYCESVVGSMTVATLLGASWMANTSK